jgi:hypothetical protein
MAISRRQFAGLIATGSRSAALPGVASPEDAGRFTRSLEQPARLDGKVLGYFRRALSEHYAADKAFGPAG